MGRKALGRGLSGLIPQGNKESAVAVADAPQDENGVVELPVGRIVASRWQPRAHFNDQKLAALADSIREQGLVQPVVVRKKDNGEYELIAGERRLRAVTMLGWETVRACLLDAGDERMRELALVENLQRDDLNAIETAVSYDMLQREEGLTHEQIAARLGVSRASITNFIRLLKLPEEVKQMVAEGELSAGHARTILALGDAMSQIDLAKKVVREKIPVQELEKIVKRINTPAAARKEKLTKTSVVSKDPYVADIENKLRSKLGVKVDINDQGGKGKIEIEYYSYDDINRLFEYLGIFGD